MISKKSISFLVISILIISCDSDSPTSTFNHGDIAPTGTILIDHNDASITSINEQDIFLAKQKLHIAYGHTSHGSQITTGMQGLVNFKGEQYAFNNGGKLSRRSSGSECNNLVLVWTS